MKNGKHSLFSALQPALSFSSLSSGSARNPGQTLLSTQQGWALRKGRFVCNESVYSCMREIVVAMVFSHSNAEEDGNVMKVFFRIKISRTRASCFGEKESSCCQNVSPTWQKCQAGPACSVHGLQRAYLEWELAGARSLLPTCIQLRLNDMQGYTPRVCFPSDASQVADTSACRFVGSVLL